jgi:hypothetical protein
MKIETKVKAIAESAFCVDHIKQQTNDLWCNFFKFNFVQEIIFLFPKNIISPFIHGSIELFFNLLLDHI